jgi:iron complex outermembrane receptor protein
MRDSRKTLLKLSAAFVPPRSKLLMSSALVAGVLAMHAPAHAEAADASAAPSTELQEVVVTAERRETKLQKTAAAVEVVGVETLQRQHVVDLMDLNSVLTSTQIVPIGTQQQIIIRGIGNNFIDTRADPAVATSINGLFYSRPLPVGFGFLDVSRVENLEGPQGTLYGRNSAAGALNIITNQPTNTFGGRLQATAGNLGAYGLTGVVNLPLGDNFAIRAAYEGERRDGYIGGFYNDTHTDMGRLSARWTPTDKLTVYAEGDYIHIGGHGGITEAYPCGNATPWSLVVPASCNALTGASASAALSGRQNSYVASGQLHLDYDLDWGSLTSISGYVGSHIRAYTLPNGGYFTNDLFSDSNDYSEELRVAGHDTADHQGGLAWQFGVFLFRSTGDFYQHTQLPTSNRPPTGTQQFTAVPQTSKAAYGQATYGLTDQLRFTAGIRYTKDNKGIDYSSSAYLPPTFTVPSPAITGSTRSSSSKFTYKLGVEYDVAPGHMVYANVSTGYASSGVNGGNSSAPLTPTLAPASFAPETITAYEVGSKNRFLNNRLQLNVAIYDYQFRNYQYLYPAFVQGGGAAHGLQIQDVSSVTAYGAEFGLEFAATSDDRFNASLALTHATFGTIAYAGFIPPATATSVVVPSGSELVNDPKWSALFGYEHTFRLDGGSTITVGANTKLSGKYLLIIGSTVPADYQKSYIMSDANIAYHFADDRYQARLWVKNIENEPVNTYGEGAGFNLYGIQAPRTYGVTLSANF